MKNDISNMPTSPHAVLKIMDSLQIHYELHEHEPVFTVAESEKIDKKINAHHTRNMFLRTKKKKNYLITLSHDTPIDLKKLDSLIEGASRFSFGSPDRLMEVLGVYPGSVTPLSAMNADPDNLSVILEKKMMEADYVAYHPLINIMTVVIKPDDLIKFLNHYGHSPIIIDMDDAAP